MIGLIVCAQLIQTVNAKWPPPRIDILLGGLHWNTAAPAQLSTLEKGFLALRGVNPRLLRVSISRYLATASDEAINVDNLWFVSNSRDLDVGVLTRLIFNDRMGRENKEAPIELIGVTDLFRRTPPWRNERGRMRLTLSDVEYVSGSWYNSLAEYDYWAGIVAAR